MNLKRSSGINGVTRREFLGRGMTSLGIGIALPMVLREAGQALAAEGADYSERILVVLELNGGNDGLNTVVPFSDDNYHRSRPTIGIEKSETLKLDDTFGLHPALGGFESLFKDGDLAIVHGCSYPNPDRSHFVSMEYWHTAMPGKPGRDGWLGRYADKVWPKRAADSVISLGDQESPAVHSPKVGAVTFDDPRRFTRIAPEQQAARIASLCESATDNHRLAFLRRATLQADESSQFVRQASRNYRTTVDYGPSFGTMNVGRDLRTIASLINAGAETRIYYCLQGGFDTHAAQGGSRGQQARLLEAVGQSLRAFFDDLERTGRADHVAVLAFTEFGRRVRENASRGTDHGVATPMFLAGKSVQGGFYGQFPSLVDLDEGDLKMTTDFRSVYATALKQWMGCRDAGSVLKGDFPTLNAFA